MPMPLKDLNKHLPKNKFRFMDLFTSKKQPERRIEMVTETKKCHNCHKHMIKMCRAITLSNSVHEMQILVYWACACGEIEPHETIAANDQSFQAEWRKVNHGR